MTRPPETPIVLKVEEAMTSAEIEIETVCPLETLTFPPGTHEYDPKRHSLIEGVSKCMNTREEAQAKFREYRDAQGPHDEVNTDGSKIDERVGAAAVINQGLYSLSGKTSYRQISWSLEAARLDVSIVVSLWNLTGTSAAVLPRYLPNFRAIGKIQTRISRLRDFTRSCGKTSYRFMNRGPEWWDDLPPAVPKTPK